MLEEISASTTAGPGILPACRDADLVDELRAIANRFGPEWRSRKSALIDRCAAAQLDDARCLVRYHDTLLFLLAYPEDRGLAKKAARELKRVAVCARAIGQRRTRAGNSRLFGTGIAWSETSHAFSYLVARWLAREHPADAELDGGEDAGRLKNALRLSLPPIEYEVVGDHRQTLDEFFKEAKGHTSATHLAWTIAEFERLPCDERVREHVFDALELFVTLSPKDGPLSRTFARGLPVPIFLHSGGLLRDFELKRLIAKPLPPARRLSRADRAGLIDTARGVLATLGRETDVIALATEAGVESFDLERGVSVTLYSMPPERRFPLDTHVGFMLFKNSIPVAYGGGWPFVGTCKIGVNVFEPFRGGESAYLFGQVLRVYAQRFVAERFLVEPYQIGEGNPEGVRSGAFWFYYRLGFRPSSSRHAALARDEFGRILAERGYRSPQTIMRRLSHADLALLVGSVAGTTGAWPDAANLSAAVSAWIARDFAGDRPIAAQAARERVARALEIRDLGGWSAAARAAFESMSLLLAMIPDLSEWSAKDRRDCVAVIRAKGARDEHEYARRSTAHRRLRSAFLAIASEYEAAR